MNGAAAIQTDRPMSPWLDHFVDKYGAITLGIGVGTAAKWALVLAEGKRLTGRMLAIDFLIGPMVALVACNVASRFGADAQAAAMVGALFALTSDRVIRLVRVRFMQKVDAELRAIAEQQMGVARQVVQAEQSGAHVIEDTLIGKAPTEYEALRKPRLPREAQ